MTEQRTKPAAKRRQLPVWQESILLVITAMVMAIIVKTFFLQAFYIPSESMEPTMLVNDKILVQKVSYWTGDVKRGDVVVFDDPGGWLGEEDSRHATNPIQRALEVVGLYPTGGHLIKRVIGVGDGGRVVVVRSGAGIGQVGELGRRTFAVRRELVDHRSVDAGVSVEVRVVKLDRAGVDLQRGRDIRVG